MGGEGRNRRVLQDIGNLVAKQGHVGINVSKPVARYLTYFVLINQSFYNRSPSSAYASCFFCLNLPIFC